MNSKRFKGSYSEGLASERTFKQVAEEQGYSHRKSSPAEDMRNHVDCFLQEDQQVLSFDVKARKRAWRASNSFQDEWMWVEFKNVTGRPGWLYGEADFIAFEREKDYLIVDRKELQRFAESQVDLESIVDNARLCEYKGYTRRGRKDLISKVKFSDVEKAIPCDYWDK